MRITVHTFLTLDGVMQSPGGPEEDAANDFERGGWLVPYADMDMGQIVEGWFSKAEAVLLGRTTYELMRPYWTQVDDPNNGVGRALNLGPKYVVSTTMRDADADWGQTTVLRSIDAVRELKETDGGELQVHGSARLAASLHAAGLVDEYRLITFPVTVGAGKRLFASDADAVGFALQSSQVTSAGAIYSELRPTDYRKGVFTVEDGKESH